MNKLTAFIIASMSASIVMIVITALNVFVLKESAQVSDFVSGFLCGSAHGLTYFVVIGFKEK